MADENDITDALMVLAGARLRNAPGRDEVAAVKATWLRVMKDIPGEMLVQAAEDHVVSGEFWPTVAEIRRAALEVKRHNGVSAAANHFAPLPEPSVTWLPSGIEQTIYPAEVEKYLDYLEMKYQGDGLPTDDELAKVARMIEAVEYA